MSFFKSITILLISVIALSQAGNIIRLCEAHAFAIAFYRLILAFFLMLPFFLYHTKASMSSKHGQENVSNIQNVSEIQDVKGKKFWGILKIAIMGIIFAFHLIAWIKAVHNTKVANAAICYSIVPVFISIGAYLFLKERLNKNLFISMGLGMFGIGLVGYDDCSTSMDMLWGDALAIISAVFFTFYFLLGKSLREKHGNLFIMNQVYLFASITCFICAQIEQIPLSGFSLKTYLAFLTLAIVPTIIGHALFIYVSKYLKASVTSTFALLEPVFAGVVAFFAFDEKLTFFVIMGYLCILVGIVYLIFTSEEAIKNPLQSEKR